MLKKYFITSISKSPKEFHSKEFHPKESHSTTDVGEIKMPKERYISPEKKYVIKICYSTKPRDRIYVKDYGFLSFAKNIGTHATKVAKNMSNKYRQKTFNSAKKVFHNKYFKISKGISFKGISSKRISFNNRCW